MRIAIFRNSSSPLKLDTYNVQEIGLAKELVNKGHDVTIYSLFLNEYSLKEIYQTRENKLFIHPIAGLRVKNDLIYGLKKNHISLEEFDVIQVQEYSQIMNPFILKKAKKLNKKTIIYQGLYHNYSGLKGIVQIIYDAIFLKSIRQSTMLQFSKTNAAYRYMLDKGFLNVKTIPVGLDIHNFQNKLKFIDTSNNKHALYVGILENRRNPHFLLDLAKVLNNYSWDITIIGKGPFAKDIINRIKKEKIKNIHYLEEVAQQDIAQHYLSSNLLLLPTAYEIFGMVILESLYFGTPVLSTPEAGPHQVIEDNSLLGSCIDLDIQLWKKEILKMEYATDVESRISRHKYIMENYSWKNIATRYIEPLKIEDFENPTDK